MIERRPVDSFPVFDRTLQLGLFHLIDVCAGADQLRNGVVDNEMGKLAGKSTWRFMKRFRNETGRRTHFVKISAW